MECILTYFPNTLWKGESVLSLLTGKVKIHPQISQITHACLRTVQADLVKKIGEICAICGFCPAKNGVPENQQG